MRARTLLLAVGVAVALTLALAHDVHHVSGETGNLASPWASRLAVPPGHRWPAFLTHEDPPTSSAGLIRSYIATQPRTAKSRLISRLVEPPDVVIFGGSRAMRFDPSYITRVTGLSAFNAAVTQARPWDAWLFLNLLHARFPNARFRFLWVVHADKFDRCPIDLAIMRNRALARYFPGWLVRDQLPHALGMVAGRCSGTAALLRRRRRLEYAPDGFVVSGFFGDPPRNGNVSATEATIRKELRLYRRSPAVFGPRSVAYFVKTLRLMHALSAAPPVIIAAPFDRRIYAVTASRGWLARHRQLCALVSRLQRHERVDFLDLSRGWRFGFAPADFYDGIHLTSGGSRKVMDLVLQRYPSLVRSCARSEAHVRRARERG